MLGNRHISDVSFANIFSQSVACLLVLLTVTFAGKLLILIKASLPINSFMDFAFAVVSKKALSYPRLSSFSPLLAFRGFIVLHFTFRSVIHSELTFMKGVRSRSRFIFWIYFIFRVVCSKNKQKVQRGNFLFKKSIISDLDTESRVLRSMTIMPYCSSEEVVLQNNSGSVISPNSLDFFFTGNQTCMVPQTVRRSVLSWEKEETHKDM